MAISTHKDSGIEKIENNREELEYLAEHGNHADYIAEALLEVAENGK